MASARIKFRPIHVGETYGQWAVDADESGSPITNAASATFRMIHRDTGRVVVNSEVATIPSPGVVEYARQPADVAVAGNYLGQFTVTHTDGRISRSARIEITILPAL